MSREVIIAQGAGFCFGVRRAVDLAEQQTRQGGEIYAYGEIIHNMHEISRLEKMGVHTAQTLDGIPDGERVLIRAHGQGLKLVDYPEISAMNIDPELFEKLGIEENGDGTLTVPVAAVIPPYLMGSGIGSNLPFRGDYDIMTHDPAKVKELGLDKLRFGDIVMLQDCDNMYGLSLIHI